MDFKEITDLARGSVRQRQAYALLKRTKILLRLEQFCPVLVGTVPLAIDIESSDLDIICCFTVPEQFKKKLIDEFGSAQDFELQIPKRIKPPAIVARFVEAGFEVEIFGQGTPIKDQFAYRHLKVEHALLKRRGPAFRQQIVDLKRQGLKTEPAFAQALGLTGDPYTALLELEEENERF